MKDSVYTLCGLVISFWNRGESRYWGNEPLGITVDLNGKRLITCLKV